MKRARPTLSNVPFEKPMDHFGHHFEHDEKATQEAQKDADAFMGAHMEVKRGWPDCSAPNRFRGAGGNRAASARARGLQRNMTDDRRL